MRRFNKRKGGKGKPDEDDSDVDSKGNIRGLIDYDYTSSEEDESYVPSTTSSSEKSPIARRTRGAKRQQTKVQKKRKLGKRELKKRIMELDEESADSDSSEEIVKKRAPSKKSSAKKNILKKRKESSSEEEMATESSTPMEEDSEEEISEEEIDESEEEDDDQSEEEDEDSEEEDRSMPGGIVFSFGAPDDDAMVPKRHNMKKEPKEVKKFVELITKQTDENTIDAQIDQFKALPEDQQKKLLDVLEKRNANPSTANPQQGLMFKILTMNLPAETQSMVLSKYQAMQNLDPGSSEYFKMRNWLEKLTSLPLGIYKEIPVKIADGQEACGAFMERARKCLDDAIYGQDEAKLQVLQFIGTKIANPDGRGLSLLLAGPPGIGKTSLIKNGIAKALNWPFQFISLGGDSDASTYTGHQLVYESSHCGKIVNSLAAAKSMSMVLMFDELDKISTTPKGEEVQHLLVHLTDPVQNGEFEDKYLAGIPIDLSRVMFAFSANDLNRIDRVLLDRFVVINLKGYSAKEKLAIAENYLWPVALKEVGLEEKVGIQKEALQYILEHHASDETGVRELKRCLEQVAQKINMLRMFNTKDLPFHIKDFTLPFTVKKEHIDLFLKKQKNELDEIAKQLYI